MTAPSVPALRQDYQQPLADAVRNAYREGIKCPLVRADTGAGKTILFSYITHGANARGVAVLIAAHRKEIIRQISLSLARFGVEHQVIAPADKVRQIKAAHFRAFGRSYVSSSARVMVGSVQTIVSRFDVIDRTLERMEQPDGTPPKMIVIMDEGHHVVEGTQWGHVMDRYHVERGALGLIVTASPQRLDGKGLGRGHGGYADTIIHCEPMSWLIGRGYLSPYTVKTVPPEKQLDLSGVRKRMGDFVASEVEERVDKPSVTGDAIAHWRQHANGLRAVVFCVSVTHSEHVAAQFNAAGIPAAHIDGKIDDSARDQAIMDYADGKVVILTNVNLISEGFDLASIAQKDVTIDCIIDLAPTESLVNAMQRWGRALRPAPGKTAVLLDHAGNVYRHGLPDDDREWTLEGRKVSKRADGDTAPEINLVTCPECRSITRPVPVCPGIKPDGRPCLHVYPIKERKVEQIDGELVELSAEDIEAIRQQRRAEQGKAKGLEALLAMGYSLGRATKIEEARDAKARLIEEVLALLLALRDDRGVGIYQTFGVTMSDVRKMKPKQLRELKAVALRKESELQSKSVYIVTIEA